MKVDVRRGEVVRQLARDNYDVNDAWVCDKGRFAFRFPDAPDRITTPLIRDRGLEPASFGEVLTRWPSGPHGAAGRRPHRRPADGRGLLRAVQAGAHGAPHERPRPPAVAGAGEAERDVAAPALSVTYKDVERAKVILVAGLDAEQEVPILHLRLRKAARAGAKIWVLHPRRTRLHDVATHILCRPARRCALLELRGPCRDADFDAADRGAPGGGRGRRRHRRRAPGRGSDGAEAAMPLAFEAGARFTYVTRRANDRGALRAGVHPTLLPGRPRAIATTDSPRSRPSGGRS